MKTQNLKFTKTLKVAAVLGLVLSSFFAQAVNGDEPVDETKNSIKSHIKFPNLILPVQHTEKVPVFFTINEKGKVDFVMAKTTNKELKQEIEKQFSGLTLNKLKANVAYTIIVNFKTL